MKNVTCENKRMGAMQFDYAGSTLTFPPGLFVTSEDIALSAEARLNPADFQIVHARHPRVEAEAVVADLDLIGQNDPQIHREPSRTAAEAVAENPSLIGRGDAEPTVPQPAREGEPPPPSPIYPYPYPDPPRTVPPTGVAWPGVPDPVVAPAKGRAAKKSATAPKPPKTRAQAPKKGSSARKTKE